MMLLFKAKSNSSSFSFCQNFNPAERDMWLWFMSIDDKHMLKVLFFNLAVCSLNGWQLSFLPGLALHHINCVLSSLAKWLSICLFVPMSISGLWCNLQQKSELLCIHMLYSICCPEQNLNMQIERAALGLQLS